MSTTINIMDEFPALPISQKKETSSKRSCSACSSVSTTSIGATEEVARIQNGDYYFTENLTLRPYFKCRCRCCNNSVPAKGEWEMPCEKSLTLSKGIKVEVTDSKILYVNGEKYSVAFVEGHYSLAYGQRRVRGWVLTQYLNRRFSTSQSLLRAPQREVYVDRSRSPSMAPEPMFEFGDLVEVRADASAKWVRGEVKKENPLLILVEGASRPQQFRISNVRQCQTRQFVTTEDLMVRKQKHIDNWGTTTLKAGTAVSVVYMDGYEGRIVAPVQGWISMRTRHSVKVVEPNFTFSSQKPTIIVKNLPGDITISELKRNLTFRGFVVPETIEMQSKGDEFRALVTLSSKRKPAESLVEKKILSIGEMGQGKQATVCWDMRYLKNRAAWKLHRMTKK